MVRAYARNELLPHAARLDEQPRFPREALRGLAGLGLLGVTTPERYGGSGLGALAMVTALEEIAAADASVATIMAVTNGFPQSSLLDYGTEEQRQRWLPPLAKKSEEHTSELHHVAISYAVFCLKKKKKNNKHHNA